MADARNVLAAPEVTTLSFDCYGTLVDWETGACNALRTIYGYSPDAVSDDLLIDRFLEADARIIQSNIFPYARVLEAVAGEISEKVLGRSDPACGAAFAASLPTWPVFEETNTALTALSQRYRLAIISNVDEELITQTVKGFDVAFDVVMTSERARCYKPGNAIFEQALNALQEDPKHVVHVAEGLCEARPAGQLGMRSIWVRRSQRSDDGSKATPDAIVSSLSELVASMP
ncbi:MAG: HAD-IA family hydrolase [Pseudomonadota bacterium]